MTGQLQVTGPLLAIGQLMSLMETGVLMPVTGVLMPATGVLMLATGALMPLMATGELMPALLVTGQLLDRRVFLCAVRRGPLQD